MWFILSLTHFFVVFMRHHSMKFGLFYGNFYVELGNSSGPKLEGQNTIALFASLKKKRKDFLWKMGKF